MGEGQGVRPEVVKEGWGRAQRTGLGAKGRYSEGARLREGGPKPNRHTLNSKITKLPLKFTFSIFRITWNFRGFTGFSGL